MSKKIKHITNLTINQLQEALQQMGQPAFRSKQVLKWVYQKRAGSFDDMKNIPKTVREKLKKKFSVKKLSIKYLLESKNGDAVKFGFESDKDDGIVESVILYDGKRRSLCISSQFGCALGCVFCETGNMGFIRNLTQQEILGQLIAADDYLISLSNKLVTNIIFMGMGEALLNYDNFLSSLEIIMNDDCFGMTGRRITVSTAGIIPSIERFVNEEINIGLAISLNSYSNEKRNKIMPINKKYPIENLIKTVRYYYKKLKGVPCKINLIPINPFTNSRKCTPTEDLLNQFAKRLAENGLSVTVRKSRGQDINAACGQLASKR
jgi:23S rRNA (adenine2503-C2)-methyltransferase